MKSGRFFKFLFYSMLKASKNVPSGNTTLEAVCISAVERHLLVGKTFLRVTDISQALTHSFSEVREELLQDPRVFPKSCSPNILILDPDMGVN